MNVELIYERSCPNIEAARTRLVQAFHRSRIPAKWCEWEVCRPETPEYARQYGSPTILVDGSDVSGDDNQASSNSCRLYPTGTGYEPVPTVKKIAGALNRAASNETVTGKSRGFSIAALPSLGVVLLPKLTCPVCWPAYTALLSSAGINFVNYTPYLLPTIAILLMISLWALAYRAPARRGYGPFWLGLLGSFITLIGKFVIENDLALYLGIGLLIAASLWNILPRKLSLRTTPIST
jgi:hypothetical protein